MSRITRGGGDKDEVEKLYKLALEGKKFKPISKSETTKSNTVHTSTPIKDSETISKQVDISLENTLIEESLFDNTLETETSEPSSDDSQRITDTKLINARNKIITNYKYKGTESDSDETETMAQNPFATLKYAVEAVPFFDGNHSSLTYFIEGCEEAKSMLPKEAESQLTKIIRTKIVGEARRTIQDRDFDNITQLTSYLKQIYGPSKNVYQLQGELGCIYQKNEEDVITYANRVKILGKQILEAYKSSNQGNTVDPQIKTSLEKDMNKCFIRGLKPEIEQRIARNLGIEDTVADALRLERELRAMIDLRQGPSTDSGKNNLHTINRTRETCQICLKEGHAASNCRKLTQLPSQIYNKTGLGTDILICQICKKRGHSADKCRFRDPQSRQTINVVQEKSIACQICSKSGHSAKTCRQSNGADVNNKTPVTCQWCDKTGHSAKNCWKKQNEERNFENKPRVTCQLCDRFGHAAKECRLKTNQQSTPQDISFCRYCKENGHLLENCQLRINSNNRRKDTNQGNYTGPSTSGVQRGAEPTIHPPVSREVK